MRVADLTTVELQRLGSAVLRAYLDASAGHQPMPSMRACVATVSARTLPESVAASHADMGPVIVVRQGSDRAYVAAAVPNSTADQAAGMTLLAAELTTRDGTLRAARLGHFPEREVRTSERWPLDPDPPEHLTKLLGPVPVSEGARAQWVTAAAVVTDYRETWHIEENNSALGPLPEDPEQRRERERALMFTRELVAAIDQQEPGRLSAGREVEGPDLSR